MPAFAAGGASGGGGSGGADSTTGTGGAGQPSIAESGSGGGAGATGGAGGGADSAAGGTGGTANGGAGGDGSNSGTDTTGSGGGGGAHGTVTTTLGSGPFQGGKGGDGGNGIAVNVSKAGGGGGAGGYGAVITGSGTSSNTSSLTGGMGGHGGAGGTGTLTGPSSNGGGGGTGGTGVTFTATGATFINAAGATTTGGQGGRGGDSTGGNGGAAGTGGDGVDSQGTTLTVNNAGTITGALGNAGGSGTVQGSAAAGGRGINGTTLTITNSGSGLITGGRAGDAFNDNATAGSGGAGINGVTVTVTNSGTATITGGQGGITNIGSTATGGAGGTAINGTTLDITNGGSATIAGGAGGGNGGAGAGAGGVGGAAVTGSGGTVANSGAASIAGGAGGAGSDGTSAFPGASGAAGGAGGAGISGSGLSIANTGSITGGIGGRGGDAQGGIHVGGNGGAGGDGITGSNLTIVNSGSIAGGTGGRAGNGLPSGTVGAAGNAITFTGGSNSLELQAGYSVTGNVVVQGGATGALILGGSTNASFDASSIGSTAQYRGFTALQKTGTSIWTLGNTAATTVAWTVTGGLVNFSSASNFGTGQITLNGGGLQWATGTSTDISGQLAAIGTGGATFDTNGNDVTFNSSLSGSGSLTKTGSGTLTLNNGTGYTGAMTVLAGTLSVGANTAGLPSSSSLTLGAVGATFDISNATGHFSMGDLSGVAGTTINLGGNQLQVGQGSSNSTTFAGVIQGSGSFSAVGTGTLTLTGDNIYTGTTAMVGGVLALKDSGSIASSQQVILDTSSTFDVSQTSAGATVQGLRSGLPGNGIVALGNRTLTITGTSGSSGGVSFSGVIQDSAISGATGGALTIGNGTDTASQTLSGSNTYTGATTINANATLALSGSGSIASSSGVNLAGAGATFDISGTTLGATIKDLSGVAGTTITLGNHTLTLGTSNSTTFAGSITGIGNIIKNGSGTLTLSGTSTYGSTEVAGGQLTVTGNLSSNVAVDAGASFGGTGTITGNVTVNGNIRPDIGTMNIVGAYTQGGGSTYTVEVNAAGQSDLINVTGNALISNTSTVSVVADAGSYRRQTRYTILTASTGVTGTYGGVTSNFAFLTPALSYDANNVFLTLLSSANSFRNGAQTPNQAAVGTALDNASSSATGDFATVLNALYSLSTAQGPAALDSLGGQNYSGFASLQVQSAQLFMDSFSLHAGGGFGTGGGASVPGGSTYQALKVGMADACSNACDVEPLWGAWGGGMGAFGTVAGDSNGHGLTYNLGGFIAGLDRRFMPGFSAGVATGFNAATLYTQGMPGTGTSNTLQFALYGEYAPGPFYLDAVAGYGHSDNRMNRPIVIPGLPFRMAQGYTTANTFFGQLETGYKIPVAPSFGGFITPFARLQVSTSTQAGFSETGADSLNLTVAQQTTQSLRTILGAQLGAGIDAPWHDKLDLVFRLGWSHEYADLSRPVTAAFAGAPALSFTTFGAQAPRDGAVIGLGANTQVAEHTSLYLRYDGDFAGANTNHVLNAGVRMTW